MPNIRNKNISRNVYVFISCLVLSAALWFLTVMNGTHTDKVQVPIHYTNLPENMMVINNLPDHISVKVKAKGFRLLSNYLFNSWSSLEINVDPGQDMKKGKRNYYVLPMKHKLEEIGSQLGQDVTIISVEPDSIYFQFDSRATKKVPVVMNGDISFEKQFGQSGPVKFVPDSVVISGSLHLLENTDSVMTEFFTAPLLAENYESVIRLVKEDGIRLSRDEVKLYVPVEQLTEKVIEIPVKVTGVPDNEEMKIIPDKVTVSILVPISYFTQVRPELIEVTAEYPVNRLTNIQKVIVSVTRKPYYVKVIKIEPASVEYLIMIKK